MSKPNTRAIIGANIRQNGQQLITGQVLNATLNAMVTDYAEQDALDDLKEKVNALVLGAFYGYFPDSDSLPADVTTPGYAYVGSDNSYEIWNFNGESWSDSGTSIDMNDADEEDITRNADGKLQFKDRSYGDGMGYVILRKDKTFAEQVTEANTIYEIRYDFSVGGTQESPVEMPGNSILLFSGGTLEDGFLKCANTCFCGDIRFSCLLSGSLMNENLPVSAFCGDDASVNTSIVSSIFNLLDDVSLILDKDLSLNGSTLVVRYVSIIGDGVHKIIDVCRFNFSESVKVKDVIMTSVTPKTYIFYNTSINGCDIEIIETEINATNVAYVLYSNVGNASGIVHIKVDGCNIYGFNQYAIRCNNACVAVIENNHIHDCGTNTFVATGGIMLGEDVTYGADNCLISNNLIENIQCVFSSQDDGREVHGILIYGNSNTITHNKIKNIYSLNEQGEHGDPGRDSEGLYLKGGDNLVAYNYVYFAGGSQSDASITIKGGRPNNRFIGNVVHYNQSGGIISYNPYTIVDGNILYAYDAALTGVYFVSGANHCAAVNNTLVHAFAGNISSSAAFICYDLSDCRIINNKTLNYTTFVQINKSIDLVVEDNDFKCENIPIDTISGGGRMLNFQSIPVGASFLFRHNRFVFKGCAIGGVYYFIYTSTDISLKENTFVFGNYIDGDIVVHTSATRFIRSDTILMEGNQITYEDGCSVTLFYTGGSSVFRYNVIGAAKIPTLNCIHYKNRLKGVLDVGTTEQRPSTTSATLAIDAWFEYFDTTIGKPVYWTGSKWVDATGADA